MGPKRRMTRRPGLKNMMFAGPQFNPTNIRRVRRRHCLAGAICETPKATCGGEAPEPPMLA
eukprot:1305047-Lingulodinium_polyedra.AAC.1